MFILSAVYLCASATAAGGPSPSRKGNVWLETSWAVVPFVLAMGFYVWATRMFLVQQRPPANALPIDVVAKQWMWKLEHPNGRREINELHVPVGRPVRLMMTSQDVIHSFYVPALPHQAGRAAGPLHRSSGSPPTGPATITCSAPSTAAPSIRAMSGRVVVHAAGGLRALARRRPQGDRGSPQRGGALFRALRLQRLPRRRARRCTRPTLAGLYGQPVPLARRPHVAADETLHARLDPAAATKDVVAGYEPIMPTFAGEIERRQTWSSSIAYIKSLDQPGRRMTRTRDERRPRASGTPRTATSTTGTRSRPGCSRTDHKRIAHPVRDGDHGLLLRRRRRGDADPARAADAARRPAVATTTYNKLFTLHGVIMVWFFLIPSIPTMLGNFLLPLMIGARDLAFPRLNLRAGTSTSPAGCSRWSR